MYALASLLLMGSATAPSLSGPWLLNGAHLELKQDGATVVGTLASAGGPCAVPVGTELLRGSLLDDSLAAQVRLCLVSAACGADPANALAVLLVTNQLTGGVHAEAACAADVRALTLRKPGTAQALTPPPDNSRLSHTPPPKPRKLASSDAPSPDRAADRTRSSQRVASAAAEFHAPATEPARESADAPASPQLVRTEIAGPDALLLRGLAELQDGRFEAARKLFREALRKEPECVEAYNGVGVTFYARGDYDEALAWYKRAIEVDPRFGDAYYNMACLYALQGQKQLAFRYLRLAALNHYSELEQLLADPDLASLHGDPQLKDLVEQMSVALKPSHAGGTP